MYAYRAVSRCLPTRGGIGDYRVSYEVLQPEVARVGKLAAFRARAAAAVEAEARAGGGKGPAALDALLGVVDACVRLDAAVRSRSALTNDFSWYKRCVVKLRDELPDAERLAREVDEQQAMLATADALVGLLSETWRRVAGGHALALAALRRAVERLEAAEPAADAVGDPVSARSPPQRAPFPQRPLVLWLERHALLRALPTLLGVWCADKIPGDKALRALLDRALRQLRVTPVVPVMGDLHIAPARALARCAPLAQFGQQSPMHLYLVPPKALPQKALDALKGRYSLAHMLPQVQDRHDALLGRWAALCGDAGRVKTDQTSALWGPVVSTLVALLSLASEIAGRVLEQAAWKSARPAPPPPNATRDGVTAYELAVRYAYLPADKHALLAALELLRGICDAVTTAAPMVEALVARAAHAEVERLAHGVAPQMAKAAEKNKPEVAALAGALAALSATGDGRPPGSIAAPPSPERLDALLAAVSAVLSLAEARERRNSVFSHTFSTANMRALHGFAGFASTLPLLLDAAETARRATHLGDLLLRETYREVAGRVQFPVEMSLPWVLAEHGAREGVMPHMALTALSLYDDAADAALDPQRLCSRVVYDEVEAELDLVFDMLNVELTEGVFNCAKARAAARSLGGEYRKAAGAKGRGAVPLGMAARDWSTLCSASAPLLRLLGRSVDVRALLAARVKRALREDLEHAIDTHLECRALTAVCELDALLDVLRSAHALMEQDGLELGDFEATLREVCGACGVLPLGGLVAVAVSDELLSDVAPATALCMATQRMIRSNAAAAHAPSHRRPAAQPPPRQLYPYGHKALNASFGHLASLSSAFFGAPHAAAVRRLLARTNSGPACLEAIFEGVESMLTKHLAPFVAALAESLPREPKLPDAGYGLEACIKAHNAAMERVLGYPQLREGPLQALRELGNTLYFVLLLDGAEADALARAVVHTAPLMGRAPLGEDRLRGGRGGGAHPLVAAAEDAAAKAAEKRAGPRAPLAEAARAARRAAVLYDGEGDGTSGGPGLFRRVLERLAGFLRAEEGGLAAAWAPARERRRLHGDPDKPEFHTTFSALLFAQVVGGVADRKAFGDGALFGGAVLVHLLEQRWRWRALDGTLHLLAVAEAAPAPSSGATVAFLSEARRAVDVVESTLSMCEGARPAAVPAADCLDPLEWMAPPQEAARMAVAQPVGAVAAIRTAAERAVAEATDREPPPPAVAGAGELHAPSKGPPLQLPRTAPPAPPAALAAALPPPVASPPAAASVAAAPPLAPEATVVPMHAAVPAAPSAAPSAAHAAVPAPPTTLAGDYRLNTLSSPATPTTPAALSSDVQLDALSTPVLGALASIARRSGLGERGT